MQHPDFRIRGKVFAALGPDGDWGMLKLTPESQADWMKAEPGCSNHRRERGASAAIRA